MLKIYHAKAMATVHHHLHLRHVLHHPIIRELAL